MPNWTFNNLEVEGNEASRKKFASDHKSVRKTWKNDKQDGCETELDFSASVWDSEYAKNHKYSTDGYSWCCEHWGTKWNACEVDTYDDGVMLHYSFDTAWSPPHDWLLEASKKYPNLTFTLTATEESDAFLYGVEVSNGKILKQYDTGDVLGAVMEKADITLEQRVEFNSSDWYDDDELREIYSSTQHEILGDKKSW
jgi:hypothetical protein